MVGDPGIEPGMGLPGGVTVRCRTLQLVARRRGALLRDAASVNTQKLGGRRGAGPLQSAHSGSPVKTTVSQRSGVSAPMASPTSSRRASHSAMVRAGKSAGTMK